MQPNAALRGYRERVALWKKRIEIFMLTQDKTVQQFWKTTKTTRRLSLGADSRLFAWDVCGRKLYSISATSARFDFDGGVCASILMSEPGSEVAFRKLDVGRNPVHLGGDVFLAVDAVEPFVSTPEGDEIHLIAYCGAGPNGNWARGTVVGTQEEFNIKFSDDQ